jgi:prepilin-type N-terminal cleavage/methylation domain-containing protein
LILNRSNPQKGFTLPEVVITTGVFLLFVLSLLGLMIIGMRYFKMADADVAAQQNCREILDVIGNELRQAAPCPDPGQGSQPARGYLGITPAVGSTAVLYPNKNTTTATYLEFTEPNYTTFDPTATGFDRTNPSNYQKIKYYISGKTLKREVITYTTSGTVSNTKTDDVAVSRNGSIALNVAWASNRVFNITVTTAEGQKKYTGSIKVFVLVE